MKIWNWSRILVGTGIQYWLLTVVSIIIMTWDHSSRKSQHLSSKKTPCMREETWLLERRIKQIKSTKLTTNLTMFTTSLSSLSTWKLTRKAYFWTNRVRSLPSTKTTTNGASGVPRTYVTCKEIKETRPRKIRSRLSNHLNKCWLSQWWWHRIMKTTWNKAKPSLKRPLQLRFTIKWIRGTSMQMAETHTWHSCRLTTSPRVITCLRRTITLNDSSEMKPSCYLKLKLLLW